MLIPLAGACADRDDEVALEDDAIEAPIGADQMEPVTEPAMDERTGAQLRVDSLEGVGPYLTDASGRALYLLEGEPEGESTCYEECAEEWPPYLAPEGRAVAGAPDVQEDLIGTTERRDGSTQVTYAGQPLYYYHDDTAPGQTEGHHDMDEWGMWHLVAPDGTAIEEQRDGGGGG